MPVTILSGVQNDSTILSNQRVVDMDDVIALLDPEVSQFTTMLMKVSSKEAFSSKVEWLEDELFPRLSAVNGAQTDSDTSLEVTASQGDYFRAQDIVRNARTGEAILVSSISTDTLTVVRGIGDVAAAAMSDGDQLVIIGNAALQGASLGTRKMTKKVHNYNYCQIERTPYGFTNTLKASKLYGGSEPDSERKKKLVEHKRAMEQILFLGARDLITSGAHPQGFAGGAFEYISTNVKNAGGTLTKANFDLYMKDLLQHGSQNKVLFAAPTVAMAISGFLRDNWVQAPPKTRVFGAKVDSFISGAYGYSIPVVVKREWNDFSTASTQYGGWAFLIDMDYVKLRPLRPTQLLRDRQANDADTVDEEYLSEFSLEFQQERVHGLIKGVTG